MKQPTFHAKSLGDKVTRLRKMHDWTQEEFATKVGMHVTNVSRLENDRLRPKPQTLRRVADVLGVSVDELLEAEGDSPPQVHDPQLLKTMQQVQELDQDDRMVVVRVVQALVAKKRMEQAFNL